MIVNLHGTLVPPADKYAAIVALKGSVDEAEQCIRMRYSMMHNGIAQYVSLLYRHQFDTGFAKIIEDLEITAEELFASARHICYILDCTRQWNPNLPELEPPLDRNVVAANLLRIGAPAHGLVNI